MPIYEYQCIDCNNNFEKLVGFSDKNINSPECPNCQSENTHKRLSVIANFSSNRTGNASSQTCGSTGPFR